ncbi:4-diphosphocytidyl-2-C-methyl-D-erythritol kinase [Carex littledalei]|uniref:4-diphosphocytidyl-2-C-methyl-D-erythritol kinase n=1 Tax=Carex littledalei TaxID=544730 RepID=A0A833R006_9POAL|nr:4-diphosphocytidyl-2-C-methyl-D-erythritol kinase [Carex littledalei]
MKFSQQHPGLRFMSLKNNIYVVSLGDTVKFSLSPTKTKDRLSTNVPGVPLDERNLIIKALNLYRKKTGTDNFFWIHLDKKVPTGAGLGGGSSNAATALWAANQFSGCIASEDDLQEWSAEIGSDIPFFFSHGAAYCTGRGELGINKKKRWDHKSHEGLKNQHYYSSTNTGISSVKSAMSRK